MNNILTTSYQGARCEQEVLTEEQKSAHILRTGDVPKLAAWKKKTEA